MHPSIKLGFLLKQRVNTLIVTALGNMHKMCLEIH